MLPTLSQAHVANKTILLRADLNVPMEGGRVTDATRIERSLPSIRELADKGARVVVISHFARPEGKFEPSMSLAPLVDSLSASLGREVRFGVDCIGNAAHEAVAAVPMGGIILLENLRFHAEEEKNDANFAQALSQLADIYVNDAFSCSHRAHASITGVAKLLPSFAGRLLQEEVEALSAMFENPARPMAAIVGGSKVSTKLDLLHNLIDKVEMLAIGGAMANTFLLAQGHDVGKSKCERDMLPTARAVLKRAEEKNCRVLLPVDLVVTEKFEPKARCRVVPVNAVPETHTATDIGPLTVARWAEALSTCKTIVWNGPVGAFETSPFDASTVHLARSLAAFTESGASRTIAGGGDTVAALAHAGMSDAFTYLSTAGGAFLEWLEGKPLPGIQALYAAHTQEKLKGAL